MDLSRIYLAVIGFFVKKGEIQILDLNIPGTYLKKDDLRLFNLVALGENSSASLGNLPLSQFVSADVIMLLMFLFYFYLHKRSKV